jgi:hypothetical protein
MALEDMSIGKRRWSGSMYTVLRRYLDSSIGKPWAEVFSRACKVADSSTLFGHDLRNAIERDVDHHYNRENHHYADWYVDSDGLLQKYVQTSWKRKLQEKRNNAPIERIFFDVDDINIWYELIEIPDGPRESKYTKFHKEWFCFERSVEYKTHPVRPEDVKYYLGKQDPRLRKGRRGYYMEYTREVIKQRQVDHQTAEDLRVISMRQTLTGKRKYRFTRLSYGSLHDDRKLTAYVHLYK